MIALATDRLRVVVAEPEEFPNVTSRFDRAGFITSVILDGKAEFCTREPTNLVHPTTGGVGLCNEFLFPEPGSEAKKGDWFPKLGIGLFRKPDEAPYCFYRKYETKPFPVTWEQTQSSVVFTTSPILCMGYAVCERKEITVEGNRLAMRVRLENTGERPLDLKEFCHNFMTLEGLPIGPGYSLTMPGVIDTGDETMSGTILKHACGFTFSGYHSEAALVSLGPESIREDACFQWTLSNQNSDGSVVVRDDFSPYGIDLWAIDHIISVETFRHVVLAPGESDTWTREWTFCRREEKL